MCVWGGGGGARRREGGCHEERVGRGSLRRRRGPGVNTICVPRMGRERSTYDGVSTRSTYDGVSTEFLQWGEHGVPGWEKKRWVPHRRVYRYYIMVH